MCLEWIACCLRRDSLCQLSVYANLVEFRSECKFEACMLNCKSCCTRWWRQRVCFLFSEKLLFITSCGETKMADRELISINAGAHAGVHSWKAWKVSVRILMFCRVAIIEKTVWEGLWRVDGEEIVAFTGGIIDTSLWKDRSTRNAFCERFPT